MSQSFVVQRLIVVFFIFIRLGGVSAQTAAEVLPGAGSLPAWEASYDAMAYEGEDLFFLINGGADLYMEYGFVDVAAVELKHPEKGSVYIELYRMDSDSAAYGIFSLRKGNLKAELNPAPWVVYGDDFLHVWQGPFYMSVSGGRLEKGARLEVFASLIGVLSEKAPAENRIPELARQLRQENLRAAAYIMGPLALNNIYNVGFQDVFQVKEGIVLEKEDGREIILNYSAAHLAQQAFNSAVLFYQDNARVQGFYKTENSFRFTDRQNQIVTIGFAGQQITLTIDRAG